MARRSGYFRWWKSLIAGVLVGIGLWLAQGAFDGWGKPEFAGGLSVRRFTELTAAGRTAGDGVPTLTDLLVHPPLDGKHLVTGHTVGGSQSEASFEFLAPMPFAVPATRDGTRPAQSFASVREYLVSVRSTYRNAWWEEPRVRATLWIGTPIVLLGIVLPLLMELLMRLGVIERPPVIVEPPPAPPRAPEPPPPVPMVDHAAIDAQLRAATEDLEHRLARPSDDADARPVDKKSGPPGRTFIGTASPDAPVPAPPKEETTFDGGVYYPVHRPKRGE